MLPAHSMRLRTLSIFASMFVAVCALAPRAAHAQALSLNPAADVAQVPRVDATGTTVGKRVNQTPDGVSYADCANDLRIRATLAPSPIDANQSIQVWASIGSDDCSDKTLRSGTTQRCWKVAADRSLSTTLQIDVRFQDMLNIPSILTSPTTYPTAYTPATSSVCGKIDYNTVNVYFLLISGSEAVAKQSLSYVVDTIGPAALSGVTVTPGDTRLTVNFTPSGTTVDEAGTSTNTGTTTSQVTIFWTPTTGKPATTEVCDASTTTTTTDTTDASTSDDDASTTDTTDDASDSADTDATTTSTETGATSTTCTSAADACYAPEFDLETGEIPAATVPSGTTGQSSSSFIINGLENGKTYSVAIAATDAFGNVGALSAVACGAPLALDDFWETYKKAGGAAEGCSTTLFPSGGSLATFIVASVAFVSTLVRRNRRKNGASK